MTDLKQTAQRLIELDGERTPGALYFDHETNRAYIQGGKDNPYSEPVCSDYSTVDYDFAVQSFAYAPAIAQAYLDKCEEVEKAIERIFLVEEANSNLKAENERLREALDRLLHFARTKERTMTDFKDGGPAFPSEQGQTNDGIWNQTYEPGMSLRNYYAGQALAGICANPSFFGSLFQQSPDAAAEFAADAADAMLKAREQ